MAESKENSEIQLTRVYDAPVQAVWEAWVDPEQAALWWGPRGFSITTHSKDLRAGGHWKYTMQGPEGVAYENRTVYLEVEELKKLVYDHGGNENQPPLFRVTVVFHQLIERTRMEMTMRFPSPAAAREARTYIRQAQGETTWDRLAEYLEKTLNGQEKFVIHRVFDASIEQLYEVWTTPAHLLKWVPPTGFTMEYLAANLSPGGDAFYVMRSPGGAMYGKAHYLELNEPHRLVYTQQFANERGEIARHPMAPTWPESLLTQVELSSEGASQTRVKLTWTPHGNVSQEEIKTFVNARAGMTSGWTGSFDKLERYLQAL